MQFDETKYKNEYARTNYDRILLLLPKGYKEFISKAAKEKGISNNNLIKQAIENYITTQK